SMPTLPVINGTHNVVITGVGGTGVVTIGAILAQAAHIDGKGAGMMEMAGLAQKGGAVHIHLRLANRPEDISAIRVALGEADAILGGDLVTTAGAKTIGLMKTGRTGAVVNSHEIITGDFTRDTEFKLPFDRLTLQLEARLSGDLRQFDASELARVLLGDSIFSNMMMLGAAWQRGLLPLGYDAIMAAIELNKAAVDGNKRAFEIGRWAAEHPEDAAKALQPAVAKKPKSLDEIIAYRADFLVKYQNTALKQRYLDLVNKANDPRLKEAVAKGYHKLLAYKDEYEVARLMLDVAAKARDEFDGDFKMRFHLSPPILGGKGANGRPKKREFGGWVMPLYRVLARLKGLRGTAFDPFGRIGERKMERALIAQYEGDMAKVLAGVTSDTLELAIALAELPLTIRGFGPVKVANEAVAAKRREELLAEFRSGAPVTVQAAE
ncbi:MAG: 2-oxoacid:acceptor oxidoreductase family protein, partial [Marinosulfonomonas sp.]|nr:2-oxoacid:acceptor oxidoreductase family protein [Marinosulfonomonas sp.]